MWSKSFHGQYIHAPQISRVIGPMGLVSLLFFLSFLFFLFLSLLLFRSLSHPSFLALIRLLETLTNQKFKRYCRKPKLQIQKMDNINIVISFMESYYRIQVRKKGESLEEGKGKEEKGLLISLLSFLIPFFLFLFSYFCRCLDLLPKRL